MKTLLFITCLALISCQKSPSETASGDSTTVVAEKDTTEVPIASHDEDPFSLDQKDNIAEFSINGKKILSFKLPDSAKVEVTPGKYGNVVAHWEPYGPVTYKSFVFQFGSGYCSMPGDEGTSTQPIDTLAYGPRFAHSQFDNLVAGANGIEEFYDVIYEGYCIRFNWTLGMSDTATPDDRKKEVSKMEEFLKQVKFD